MNLDKDGLASLLERVREAKGPDRELDFDLLEAAGFGYYDYTRSHYEYRSDDPNQLDVSKEWAFSFPTRSIDASLALVERLLPGWEYVLEGGKRHRCVLLHPGNEEGEGVFVETAPTLPLAILAALLTALKEVR